MKLLIALSLAAKVAAECPNACSGHGTCGAFDECSCYFNWQGGDCSFRTCPFAMAHVDTPKGDLDGSADSLSGPTETLITDSTVYPYGTSEQYPNMVDTSGNVLANTAHAYMECANKGICDRGSGECDCFAGYDGAACQRASCPDPTCSGHGTCQSAAELADMDYGNEYLLWDKDVTMGCMCEPGYTGPSCADKQCKYGVDPLYIDDPYMSIRAPSAYVEIKNDISDTGEELGMQYLGGTYAIKFFDVFGEDYETGPLLVNSSCATIVAALEALPNTVVPAGTTECIPYNQFGMDSIQYFLEFTGTPGSLKPIEIDLYLDGSRPSIYNVVEGNVQGVKNMSYNFNVTAKVNPHYFGVGGETVDYFSERCHNVEVTMTALTSADNIDFSPGVRGTLSSLTDAEAKLLKKCLGDSNGDVADNKQVYNWDYGMWNQTLFPHIVKLAPTPDNMDDDFDAGRFYLIWYNYEKDVFYTGNVPHDTSTELSVFTTDGVATVITNITGTTDYNGFGVGLNGDNLPFGKIDYTQFHADVTARFDSGSTTIYTSSDTSCYTGSLATCLSKGDFIFLFEANWPGNYGSRLGQAAASYSGNLYKVMKVGVNKPTQNTFGTEDRYYVVLDKPTNWDGSATMDYESLYGTTTEHPDLASKQIGTVRMIKFEPAGTNEYEYVSECSGRGLCDKSSGLCECFTGYTGDSCAEQSALSI